jgi:hypothetical protein
MNRLFKIRNEGATAHQRPPVLDYDFDSNEESATSPVPILSFWVCIANEVVASTTISLKPGSRRHLLQHPAATLMISPMILAEFDFAI